MDFIQVGSDFSGIGAFNQALNRLDVPHKHVFACDMDKYARRSYLANYEAPEYFPENVYDREIPKEPLDIYMTSPPCQAFSLAGKRKGESDKRGVLFYNSHEFIQKNKPRYFIFENVKGLLSDNGGKTFQTWIDMLGGKSVNGNTVIFPHEESVPYHVYYKVLNAKHYGVPQNRERVFIVGIRSDQDNYFRWPKPFSLKKRLKDILETFENSRFETQDEFDAYLKKYFLSDNAIERLCNNDIGFHSDPKNEFDIASTVCASDYKISRGMNVLKIKSATKKGYELATDNDSINFSNPNSETRRGRVGKGVAQTLDTGCNQGVLIGAIRGRNPENPNDRTTGAPTQQRLEINENGTSNALTTVQKDNVVVQLNISKESGGKQPYKQNRVYDINGISPVLDTECGRPSYKTDYNIRRLTPRECLRLMDFPDTFKIVCSDSQIYKQAGNSIVVACLELIIKNLIK